MKIEARRKQQISAPEAGSEKITKMLPLAM